MGSAGHFRAQVGRKQETVFDGELLTASLVNKDCVPPRRWAFKLDFCSYN